MSTPPSRSQALASGLLAALGGGVLFGLAEGARVVAGSRLGLDGAAAGTLLAVGGGTAALLGVAAALPLAVLPVRPLGRTRWSGFLAGLLGPVLASAGVTWFSDPPPFTEPWPMQGNPAGFAGIVVLAVGLAFVLYQGARGARAVAGAAIALAIGLGVWVSTAGGALPAPTQALPPGAPNVLVVTLDTTRADRIGAYGNPTVDTRHFDAIAKAGTLWTNASAVAAVTGPSHTSMFSGSGPWDHGVLLNGIPIPTDHALISEVLHDHGWATGAFVSSYVLDGEKGFARGFEVYDDDFGWLKGSSELVAFRLWAMVKRHFNPDEELERRGGDTVDAALAWMKAQKGASYTWVHLFDAHGPYEPPPPFDTMYYSGDKSDPSNTSMAPVKNVAAYLKKSLEGVTDLAYVLAQYDGEVSYADTQLGRLLEAVDQRNTLVVVIGDHGEQLGEHDVWFNHGDDVYETSVHVPFVMQWPGRVPAGLRLDDPFEGSDLAPTVLEAVGVDRPASMVGQSAAGLLGLGEGRGRIEARSMCFDREANVAARAQDPSFKPKWRMAGIRGPKSRWVQRETGRGPEFFDLTTDPAGLTDIYAATAATPEGTQLFAHLKAQADGVLSGNATERSAADVGDEERARLEALGYLDGAAPEGQ